MVRRRSWVTFGAVALVSSVASIAPALAEVPSVDGPADASAPATPGVVACPVFGVPVPVGSTSADLPELSGLAPSLTPGRWWTHNDSGDSPRIFQIDTDLRVVTELRFAVAFAFDMEDIALGPDGRIWAADIGDNLSIRPGVVLWGVGQQDASGTVTPVTLNLRYPDGAHDAESLMIDPLTGDGFIVTKEIVGGRSSVYRIPAQAFTAPPAGFVTLEPVGSIDVSDGGPIGPTAADISPSGADIVVKTLTTTYLWPRARGASVVDTLVASPHAPCRIAGAGTGEAFAFSTDGRHVATISEGVGVPLVTLERST